jgi:2-haloacid dehalogenase
LFARPSPSRAEPVPVRAIAFDGFPVLDPRSVAALARKVLGEHGDTLAAQWSTKLFGYNWLETAAGRYQDFPTLADAALRYTADAMGLALDDATRRMLVDQYNALDLWPDVRPALARLHTAGIRLAFLSNLSTSTLESNMRRNGLTDYFEPPLSADRVHRFKPAPEAYAMALGAFGMPREAIGFAAFGGWDAAGASWFGYRTVWVNRLALPAEPLDVRPEITSRGMEGVLALAGLA